MGAATLLLESAAISPPILGYEESLEGYELTEAVRYLLRVQASTLLPRSIVEILNAENNVVQGVFVGYHIGNFVNSAAIALKSNYPDLRAWVRPACFAAIAGLALMSMMNQDPKIPDVL